MTIELVICPLCHNERYVEVPADDPQLPRDLVECPCCHGRVLTKQMLRQWQRDTAAPADSPRGDTPRLYR